MAPQPSPARPSVGTSYGRYILTTGKGITGKIENIWGRYWYESRFRDVLPVADVGPGRCWFTRRDPGRIIAIDNAPDIVQRYAAEGLPIRQGSAEHLPFPDNYFGGVFCCWLLEHLPDPELAILEFHRVLKPGGLCTIVVPTPADMMAFYADYTHIRPFTTTSLRQLASVARFARTRIGYLPWTRGLRMLSSAWGECAGYRYVMIADRYLRVLGLRNWANIVLDAWK